jgi:hypothetical protein
MIFTLCCKELNDCMLIRVIPFSYAAESSIGFSLCKSRLHRLKPNGVKLRKSCKAISLCLVPVMAMGAIYVLPSGKREANLALMPSRSRRWRDVCCAPVQGQFCLALSGFT